MLDVADLAVVFGEGDRAVTAVRGVDLAVAESEFVGVVGESGSGKSVTALALMGLLDRRLAHISGRARLGDVDLLGPGAAAVRGRLISMVFQDPMTALDPVFTVGGQLAETMRAHRGLTRRAAWREAVSMLDAVGIPDPTRRARAYPHQLSGGMRQRVVIAIALCCRPRLLVADEPTTAVDATVQAQLLGLLADLRAEHGTAILLITHDMGVVAEVCDRMVTMYAGEVVEAGQVDDVLTAPQHPYTSGLLQALPGLATRGKPLATIPGRVPDGRNLMPGCLFHPRCGAVRDECRTAPIPLTGIGSGRAVRCGRSAELVLPGARR